MMIGIIISKDATAIGMAENRSMNGAATRAISESRLAAFQRCLRRIQRMDA
jgi:hypothetical protein